ncbi:PHP domain [Micromonospora halophytica]|uniref:PHP domain n=1 Tax=Micromonospora halophytica TaxID=47864 RepID=A0A1C5IB26_9ACTN|nr:PHP domain [Micromonospora halophytica]
MANGHGRADGARFPARRAAGRGRGWYRGDCHVHSVYSSGANLTAQQLAAAARVAGLDFVATTEHNNSLGHEAWGAARR